MIIHPVYKKKRKSKKKVETFDKPKQKEWKDLKSGWNGPAPYRPETKRYESKIDEFLATVPPATVCNKPKYEGELAEREEKARKELERKKKFVALTTNKGTYEFIGENPSEQVLKDLGR